MSFLFNYIKSINNNEKNNIDTNKVYMSNKAQNKIDINEIVEEYTKNDTLEDKMSIKDEINEPIITNSFLEKNKVDINSESEKNNSVSEDYSETNSEIDSDENDNFENYINKDSISPFTKNAKFCTFNWNGIEFLDKWELQRTIDKKHATNLAREMFKDYKKNNQFTFYDPIHVGKKKDDEKYYVLDGQHRLEAYLYFFRKNEYPVQQIPVIIWYVETENDFIELFQKINKRLTLDKLQLIQIKLLEIFDKLEKKYGKTIFGINRPKINKEVFSDTLRNTDNAHKMTSQEIFDKLVEINNEIRGLSRNNRLTKKLSSSIHESAENMDFFLGLDRTMSWMSKI